MNNLLSIAEVQKIDGSIKYEIYKISYKELEPYFKGKVFNQTAQVIEEIFPNLGKVTNYGNDSKYGEKYLYYTFSNYQKIWLIM